VKLAILAVGHRQPDWIATGCGEYLKRMPHELPVSLVEIKPEPRASRTPEQSRAAEKRRILQALHALGEKTRRIALDEKGEDWTTAKLSEQLSAWMQDGRDTAFLIGGADGLDAELKARADAVIRLSSLTLPHGMARLMLCEQLYRAASLLKNHPYHRQ
jgi:23S rRNA (pseudouridine1915-N3)-methyltransferase